MFNSKEKKEKSKRENEAKTEEKKKFEIKLSIDNDNKEDDLYKVDDEDEEGEEEYEYEEEEKNDSEIKEEKTLQVENKFILKNYKIKQRNIEKNPHIEEMFYRDLDAFSYCHLLYRKGNYISVGEVKTFPCLKYKHKTSLFKNKEQKVDDFSNYVKKKYLLIVDENFLYMSKDKIKPKKKENIRKIGNRINLKRLYRIKKKKKENNKVIVKFDFYTDENLTIDDKDSFFTKIYEFDTDTFSLLEDEIKFISKKVKIETK